MALVHELIQEKLQHQPHSITLSALCFIIITILCIINFTRRNKFNNLPPSPPKLPIIGNLHQFGTLPHQSLKALSNKYGPLFLLQLGQIQTLVVSSAELVEEIAKSHDVAFSNRANTKATKVFFYQGKEIGFEPYGEEWRKKRKLCILELLSTNRVRSFQPIREDEASMMVNTICEACAKGSIVNLSKMIITTSNNIASRCIFGRSFDTSDGGDGRKTIGEVVRKMTIQLTTLGVGDLFPSLDWVDVLTGFNSRLKATFTELDSVLEEVIEEHKRKKRNKNISDRSYDNKDFVDIFLQLQEKDMIEFELTRDTMKAILMDMFVGGSDTVSTALEWAFVELAKNSRCLKKAQEEVRRIVDGKSKIDENHLSQMNYMKCVIKETLRLHPPASLVPRRITSTNVKINGYNIPKKTNVYVNLYAIHRDPKLWDNAEEFIPERFEGEQQVDYYKVIDFQLIPFGFGRRGCPGASFGIASVEYLMANLLYWFDWKVPNNNNNSDGDDHDAVEIDMSEMSGMTVTKKEPLYLKPTIYSSFDFRI